MPSMLLACFCERAGESADMSAKARFLEPLLWVVKMSLEMVLEVRGRPVVLVEEGLERREVSVEEKREGGPDAVDEPGREVDLADMARRRGGLW